MRNRTYRWVLRQLVPIRLVGGGKALRCCVRQGGTHAGPADAAVSAAATTAASAAAVAAVTARARTRRRRWCTPHGCSAGTVTGFAHYSVLHAHIPVARY